MPLGRPCLPGSSHVGSAGSCPFALGVSTPASSHSNNPFPNDIRYNIASALSGVDPRPANSPAGPQTVSHLKSAMNPAMFVPTRQTTLQEAFPTSLKLWFHAAFAQTGCQVSAPRLLFSFQTQEPSRKSLVPWF